MFAAARRRRPYSRSRSSTLSTFAGLGGTRQSGSGRQARRVPPARSSNATGLCGGSRIAATAMDRHSLAKITRLDQSGRAGGAQRCRPRRVARPPFLPESRRPPECIDGRRTAAAGICRLPRLVRPARAPLHCRATAPAHSPRWPDVDPCNTCRSMINIETVSSEGFGGQPTNVAMLKITPAVTTRSISTEGRSAPTLSATGLGGGTDERPDLSAGSAAQRPRLADLRRPRKLIGSRRLAAGRNGQCPARVR